METWKIIPSFVSYEVSTFGRIRRIATARGAVVGRILALQTLPAGYKTVTFWESNKAVTRLAHRIVAEAFYGPCPNGYEVNHKDGNKANNHAGNLEYLTRSDNLLHAVAMTGAYRGTRNSQAILTEEQVRAIRLAHHSGMGYKRLAKRFSITWGCARAIATRKTWGWLK